LIFLQIKLLINCDTLKLFSFFSFFSRSLHLSPYQHIITIDYPCCWIKPDQIGSYQLLSIIARSFQKGLKIVSIFHVQQFWQNSAIWNICHMKYCNRNVFVKSSKDNFSKFSIELFLKHFTRWNNFVIRLSASSTRHYRQMNLFLINKNLQNRIKGITLWNFSRVLIKWFLKGEF